MMIDFKKTRIWIAIACVGGPCGLKADVKMPVIFGDHMVLQQNATLPVWGTADPGEKVTVKIADSTGSTTAGPDGKWSLKLTPLPAGDKPVTVTVTGKNTLTFSDVLTGDVWLCSGQSNMEFQVAQANNAHDAATNAKDQEIRLFHIPHTPRMDPQSDVTGKWEVCSPETVASFTAAGYFFAQDLRSTLKRPIGLIESSVGATPAQAWTSLSGLKKDPVLDHYVTAFNQKVADFPADSAAYPAKLAEFQAANAEWQKDVGAKYKPVYDAWKASMTAARAAGQPIPRQPAPPKPQPLLPVDPSNDIKMPTVLFNGMIAPLIPYAIKGVIWYQGESNAGNTVICEEYRTLFSRMITDWREKWGQGDFPFLFVQLAGNGPNFDNGVRDSSWAYIREAQFKTLSLPNTGLATAVDIGDAINIHPLDKLDVGHRLALAARHVAYGESLVYSGPVFDSMKFEGNSIRINFTQTGGGLIIGSAPWVAAGVPPIPTTSLTGFEIAGPDRNWFPADAKIDGASVVLSSPKAPQPVAVRYAWNNTPGANLYNKENLPTVPFRTDDWQHATPPAPPVPHAKPGPSAPAPAANASASPK